MLSMYVDLEHRRWDEVLPYVTFAYNTARQETTRMTAFALFYGRVIVVFRAGVKPDPEKIAAVSNFPTPADKKAVRRFLGLSGAS